MFMTGCHRARLSISLAAVVLLGVTALPHAQSTTSPVTLSVKNFGAIGDGITDDYDAIKNAAAAICAASAGSSLVYPPGRYRIARHKIDAGPLKNSVTDITYSNCRSVSITGYGAVIDIEGNFRRTWDYTLASGGLKMSYHNGVVPFRFVDSSNFTVAGFELDGNVDQMTRDADVIETSSVGAQNAGILTFRSSSYVLKDLNIHHFHGDGLLLGFDPLSDKNASLDSVQSRNNGRNALSILQMKGAIIVNSQFANSGRTGPYGFHLPAAGVDIEPEFTVVSSPAADVNTGDIYFKQCTFSENIGWQFVNAYAARVGAVSLSRASVVATLADSSHQALAFTNGSTVSVTENSDLRIAAGKNVHLPPPGTDLPMPTHSMYRANTFQLGRNDGILADPAKSKNIDFVENVINVTAAAPDTSYLWLRGLRTVRSNKFFVDRAGFAAAGAAHYVILTEGAIVVAENQYSTNLATAGKFFAPVYSSSAWGELFTSGPFFKPTSDWDTTRPYSLSAAPPADVTAPTILSTLVLPVDATSATISAMSNEPGFSEVEYGTTTTYGAVSARETVAVASHTIPLTGLLPNTLYYYRIRTTDRAGNLSVSASGTFTTGRTTAAPPPPTGVRIVS